MHSGEITIDNITKIEGTAGLKVIVENDAVKDLKFIIKDYRRFYTEAVKGKPFIAAPSFLSRICGTCSVAHLFASLEAIEKSQGIVVSEQTKLLRRLAYDGLMIRDHALHLYFFVLPDVLGVDSIIDISDDPNDAGHILLHDSYDIKRVGTAITDVIIGAAIHAPFPTVGGFLKLPDPSKFSDLIAGLEKVRPQVLRGIKTFFNYKASLIRNSDYLCLRNEKQFDFLEGEIINSTGRRVPEEKFHDFMKLVAIPYSQAEGYVFSDACPVPQEAPLIEHGEECTMPAAKTPKLEANPRKSNFAEWCGVHEDYLVGSLARLNFNKDLLHPRTSEDASQYLDVFPSNNVHHNNLAQAIEILQCVDDAIDILKNLKIEEQKPVRKTPQAGVGVGVVEAPRGILYHMAKINDKGIIEDYDVIVPTAQNQISIEDDLKKHFNENLIKDENTLRLEAE